VKLLLDENLSHLLLASMTELYPGSTHVREVGLAAANDEAVWAYAAREGFVIVSKDADFHQRSFVLGAPPGKCTTEGIAGLLRQFHPDLLAFERDPEGAFLALG
jgi:predicted nuclease of predicted toxin-antitoxin system